LTERLAPLALEACPPILALMLGVNFRLLQPAAWKRLETRTLAPWAPEAVPVSDIALQLVGLNVKPGRLIVTLTVRMSAGMPLCSPSTLLTNCGRGSETTVICAVCGSMRIELRTTTLPRLKGPATAGTTIERPNGPPL
jgi:hypothetical protein